MKKRLMRRGTRIEKITPPGLAPVKAIPVAGPLLQPSHSARKARAPRISRLTRNEQDGNDTYKAETAPKHQHPCIIPVHTIGY